MQDTPQATPAPDPSPGLAGDAVPSAAPDTPSPELKVCLEDLLKQAESQAKEHHDAWLRAKAETENVRKRAQDDVAKAHRYALESFSEALLPVRDSLEASLAAPNVSLESLRTGVELTLKQLASVFEKFRIGEINPVGEKFDPHCHQAIAAVESDQPESTVVQVLQKGYRLHDRIVRPAMVTVAKSKDA
jgi:molecular chaperone GrpE